MRYRYKCEKMMMGWDDGMWMRRQWEFVCWATKYMIYGRIIIWLYIICFLLLLKHTTLLTALKNNSFIMVCYILQCSWIDSVVFWRVESIRLYFDKVGGIGRELVFWNVRRRCFEIAKWSFGIEKSDRRLPTYLTRQCSWCMTTILTCSRICWMGNLWN